jgi:hypothetical protein
MIIINKIGENLVISGFNQETSCLFTPERLAKLEDIAWQSQTVRSMEDYQALWAKVEEETKDNFKEKIEAFHPGIYVSPITKKFYAKLNGGKVSSVSIPQELIDRMELSIASGISIDPLVKLWLRFLRNPKANQTDFACRFVEYINTPYVQPDVLKKLTDEGLDCQLATERATTFQVKITMEGLLNGYKVSQEIEHKFVADENGNPKKINRYAAKFDEITGEIVGSTKDELPGEDRVFMPAVVGMSHDAFYCGDTLGHIIRVGQVHRLPDWSHVNCNDHQSAVKGLHVGNINYIRNIEGEVHNVFVDPAHVGAITLDSLGAIRVLQYFVHGSLKIINRGIYHSSTYAAQTDKQWEEVKAEILKSFGELQEENAQEADEVSAL